MPLMIPAPTLFRLGAAVIAIGCAVSQAAADTQAADDTQANLKADLQTFATTIKPVLQTFCVDCHSGKTPKANIALDTIDPDLIDGKDFDHWEDIREAFNTGEMPPEDQPQPSAEQRQAMARWLDSEFKKVALQASSKPRGRVRRLTRYELQYALEDLLHTSVAKQIEALPEEGASTKTGLKNSSHLLMISSPHLEAYLNTVMSIIADLKEVTAYEPERVRADLANLDVNPAPVFVDAGKRQKPPLAKVERTENGDITIKAGGYLDLSIPAISQYRFDINLAARSDANCNTVIAIGFQRSDVDPRQVVQTLGRISIPASENIQAHTLVASPEQLPAEMTRAIDRPFFIRITNASRQPLQLDSLEYIGNNNRELTGLLFPEGDAKDQLLAQQQINRFIEQAFRRPASKREQAKYQSIHQRYLADQSPGDALLSTYQAILTSPAFLYLGMPGNSNEAIEINYQLAERLAFFLWCSVPDTELLELAGTEQLTDPKILEQQVKRLLADEKSRRFTRQFTDQWLQTSLLFNVAVDRTYYPRYRATLKPLMHQETIESVDDVFRSGASALDFLDADHVFVNQTLANFYQIKGVRGDHFRKVAVQSNHHRGGLLTQGTFLVGNSDGMNSHAILRGVWLSSLILNDPPPDPPANVPPLDESIPGFESMTLNQKLFAHRNNAACKSCHQRIDPWGIPFENYDASGAWREKVLMITKANQKGKAKRKPTFEKNYLPIDRKSTLPDGNSVDGIDTLKAYLVNERQADFARGLTERVLAYALSRDLNYADDQLVTELTARFTKSDFSVPTLIHEIVRRPQFSQGL